MGTTKRERQKANRQARIEREMREQVKARRTRSVRNFAILSVVIFLLMLWLSSRGGKDEEVATGTTTTTAATDTTIPKIPPAPGQGAAITGDTPCPAFDGSSARTTKFEKSPPMCLETGVDYVAVIETSEGQVQIALDTEKTPETANNFAVLALYHYYDNTALFRTDPSIDIIQGGAPHTNNNGDEGPGYTIDDEGDSYKYQVGDLVMARTSQPNSASAQVFFAAGPKVSNLDANPDVPGSGTYVPFGRTISGLEVLERILASHTADPSSSLGGYPTPPVTILSIAIVPADEAPVPTTAAPTTTAPATATTVPGSPATTAAPTTTAVAPSTEAPGTTL